MCRHDLKLKLVSLDAGDPRPTIAGISWHFIQSDNNRVAWFYCYDDYQFYLTTLQDQAEKFGCIYCWRQSEPIAPGWYGNFVINNNKFKEKIQKKLDGCVSSGQLRKL